MLEKMIVTLNREQIVELLSDETVDLDSLRACVCAALGGDPALLMRLAGKEPADAPKPIPVKAAPAANGTSKPKAAPAAASSNGAAKATPADKAVQGLLEAGVGFALADVVQTSGATANVARSAIQRAVAAKKAFAAGDRRFCRYGKTAKIAQAASNSARGV